MIVDRHGDGVTTWTVVERGGAKLMSGLSVAAVGTRYVATNDSVGSTPNQVLDLVSSRCTTIGPRCVLAGVRRGAAIVACSPVAEREPSSLFATGATARSASSRRSRPASFRRRRPRRLTGAGSSLYLQPNCGPGWAAVAPSDGGPARFVAGGGTVPATAISTSPPFLFGLGWTARSLIVATVARKVSWEGESSAGTFAIDPATLTRTRSTPALAAKLWGAGASG